MYSEAYEETMVLEEEIQAASREEESILAKLTERAAQNNTPDGE